MSSSYSSEDDTSSSTSQLSSSDEEVVEEVHEEEQEEEEELDINSEDDFQGSISKQELKKLREEGLEVLESLEADYRHDLGVHLYSTHLIRKKGPFSLPKKWSLWPMDLKEVYDPKHDRVYIDETDIRAKGNSRSSTKVRKEDDAGVKMETLSDPKQMLEMELDAYFSNKITAKIHEYANETGELVEPMINPPIKLPKEIRDRIMTQIAELADKLYAVKSKSQARKITWREVILLQGSLNLYDKFDKFFGYNYDYEAWETKSNTGSPQQDDDESDSDDEEIEEVPQENVRRQRQIKLREIQTDINDKVIKQRIALSNEKTKNYTNKDELSFTFDYRLDANYLKRFVKKSTSQGLEE